MTGNQTFEHGNTKFNMDTLGWYPLQERRAKFKLILYKILNIPIGLDLDRLLLILIIIIIIILFFFLGLGLIGLGLLLFYFYIV